MSFIPWILLVASILFIFFLLSKGSRTIYVDPEAEEKAKFEKEYRLKREHMFNSIAEEKKNTMVELEKEAIEMREKIREENRQLENDIEEKKQKVLLNLQDNLNLYKKQIELKKQELDAVLKEKESQNEIKIEEFESLLSDWRSREHAAIEASKRQDEIKQKDNFYKIVLNEDEVEELYELNKAIKKLRNPMPFRRAVYDIYYKPKINDLVKQVVGVGRVTGVYKITHIESQKVYIGQSVDIGNRWKQHAKRGCGADTITNNKLYPVMRDEGIESFTWEIVEEVDSNKLSESEKYWQEYYKAKDFGYSMK